MKKILLILLLVTACAKQNDVMIIRGSAQGNNGVITVDVQLKDDQITDIKIVEQSESDLITDDVFDTIIEAIIISQNINVDVVSSATNTSIGIINAVKNSFEENNLNMNMYQKTIESNVEENYLTNDYDVIVVGAGGAGLCAAATAKENNKNVLLLEKMPFAGGNTILSGGEMAVPNNWLQREDSSIIDSPELMANDIYSSGGELGNYEIALKIAENGLNSALWLRDTVGVEYQDTLSFGEGQSVYRTILPYELGYGLANPLIAYNEEIGVDIQYNARVTELLYEEERVIGVSLEYQGKKYSVYADDGVVLATGGFGANVDLREKYNSEWDDLGESILTSNSPAIQGDGILMAEAIGAKLVNMNYIQLYPLNNPATGVYYNIDYARLNGSAIVVNKEGHRFVDEMAVRDDFSKAVQEQPGEIVYGIFNQKIVDELKLDEKYDWEFEQCFEQGVLIKRDTLNECAEYFGVDVMNCVDTLNHYNTMVKSGKDIDFNRTVNFGLIEDGPYYMYEGVVSVHYTMGGIEINENAQVLDIDGNIIDNLYAAGETTGNIHGNNRLGGCSIADVVVMGIIAGEHASNN